CIRIASELHTSIGRMLILRHDQTTKHKKGLPLVAICSYDVITNTRLVPGGSESDLPQVDSHLKRPGSYQSWRVGEEASPCSKTNRVRAIRALTEAKDFSETSGKSPFSTRHMIQSSVEASGGLPSERLNPISSPMEQSTAIQVFSSFDPAVNS
ncbi:hypothetical protein BHE74_00028225, partial [Ensete ventricosum]